jgi:5-methylcytosine-specific restriction protein A
MAESWQHDRRSPEERGYGREWKRLRVTILKRDGYRCRCDDCKASGRLKPATHVDHIMSKAAWLKRWGNLNGCDAPSNLRSMHKDCHARKSLAERGYVAPKKIGADGWPVAE